MNPLLAELPAFKRLAALQRHLKHPLAAREAYPIQPYDQEEEESVLKKALGVPLSALGYIGGALDKPRRALWGAIGGKPREIGNLIPFSDALGITNEHDAIGGRQALEHLGVLGPNQEGLDTGDVVGFLAEMAGDPLTYVGGLGALGKLGKVAKKAGMAGDVLSIAAKKLGKTKVGKLEAGMNVTHADLISHAATDPKKLKALQDAAGGAQQLADLAKLNEPISGLTTVGMPFMGPGKVVGTGAKAQKVARGLDKAADFIRYSKPGREAARLFSKPVKQTAEAASQPRAAEGFHAGEAFAADARTDYGMKWQDLHETGKVHKDDWGAVSDIVGHAIERSTARDKFASGRKLAETAADYLSKNPVAPAAIPKAMNGPLKETGFVFNKHSPLTKAEQAHQHLANWLPSMGTAPHRETVEQIVQSRLAQPAALPSGSVPHPDLERLIVDIAKDARKQFDEISNMRDALGAGSKLEDVHSLYAPRSAAFDQSGAGGASKSFAMGSKSDRARAKIFRNIPKANLGPGGRGSVDNSVRDPLIAGPKPVLAHDAAVRHILDNYLDISPKDTAEMQQLSKQFKVPKGQPVPGAGTSDYWRWRSLEEAHAQADGWAKFLRENIPAENVAKGLPFYKETMADLLGKTISQKQALAAENSVHDLIVDVAARGADGPTIKQVFGGVVKELKGDNAYRTFAQRMVDRGKLNPKVLAALSDPKLKKKAEKILGRFSIPKAHAKDIERVMDFYEQPDTLKWGQKIWDRITNITKGHLTVVSPSFWSRNLQTMFWSDMLVNLGNALDPREWGNMAENWKMQHALLKGEVVKGLSKFPQFAGMTDGEATRALRAAQFGHRVASAKIGAVSDLLGPQGQDLSHFSRDIPGVTPTSPMLEAKRSIEDIRHHGKHAMNPLNMRGGYDPFTKKDVSRENFSPFFLGNIGERANNYSESLGRGATFIGQIRKGASFETAGEVSRLAHVDYGTMTRFEKEFIQRIFPFWAWAKGSIPFTLKQLMERPGGPTAKAIMASKRATEDEPFTPEQIRGSSSIPIGEGRSPGLKRYLTVDLPHETLNDWASFRPTALGTIKATGMGIASQLNPMLKAPAELVSGQSFFQKGRPLTDLYSPTGNVLLDQALTNTPASRYLSTFNQLAQPSSRKTVADKAVNTLLGVRLQDVDMPKAKQAAVREYAHELLRGSKGVKSFQDLYVPKDQLDQLDPQQTELLRLLKTQSARATAKKKPTKAEKEREKMRKKLLAGK